MTKYRIVRRPHPEAGSPGPGWAYDLEQWKTTYPWANEVRVGAWAVEERFYTLGQSETYLALLVQGSEVLQEIEIK